MSEVVSISAAAAELGIPVEILIGRMEHDGLLVPVPGSSDPRCSELPGLFRWHAPDCECWFVFGLYFDLVALPVE